MRFNQFEVAGKIQQNDGLAKFKRLLAEHDWYFAYSDDYRVWVAGMEQRKALDELAKELRMEEVCDEAFDAFKGNCLKEFLNRL